MRRIESAVAILPLLCMFFIVLGADVSEAADPDSSPEISAGDVNGDGQFDLADCVLALKNAVGKNATESITFTDADVNNDGGIGIPEAVFALKKVAENPLPRYLQPFGPDSYFPIAEGASWEYSNGNKVVMEDVNASCMGANCKAFTVNNVNDSGYYGGHVGIEPIDGEYFKRLYAGASSHADFLPQVHFMSPHPLMYENKALHSGFTWQGKLIVNTSYEYEIDEQYTVKKVDTTVTLPDGREYTDCLILERIFHYPESVDTGFATVRIDQYLQKGVGYIYSKETLGNGDVDEVYVTDTNLR